MEERIFLSPPYLTGQEEKYVLEALKSNWIAPTGPALQRFEQVVSDYAGMRYGVALTSGTAAIHLALKILGVTKGDQVICSSFTFAASCNPVIYEGAEPVLVDSDYDTWNMSPAALERALDTLRRAGNTPKAAVVVDLYGQSADMDSLLPIFQHYGVPVIEDSAESLGSQYKGQMNGSFGEMGIFSFNGNKIVTTSGGGMVVTNDADVADKIRFWATQSREPYPYYQHKELGYNYRLSNICAAIGLGQMETIDERIRRRREIYELYKEELRGLPITMMPINPKGEPNYWLAAFTIHPDVSVGPGIITQQLQSQKIESRWLWKPMQLQPFYTGCEYYTAENGVSVCEDLFKRGVCLPSGSGMTDSQVLRVAEAVKRVFA